MKLRELPQSAIIYIEYERIRCINWFVVWKCARVTAAFEKQWPSVAPGLEKYDEQRRVHLGLVAIIIKRSKRLDS